MEKYEIEQLYLIRRKKGIKLVELAEVIGCSQSLLSKFETGNANMASTKITKYREYILNK